MTTIAAVDIETDDPFLKKFGPGAIRSLGEILTVGIYCPDWGIDGWYTWDQLQEDEEAIALLEDESVIKVFHNGVYDLDWLCHWGHIDVKNIDDTMTRETLLDAYAYSYSLDACCHRRGVTGKNKAETIDDWYARHGGKGKAIEHLKEIPVNVVGEYNLQDCHATYDLYFAQQPLLEQQDLIRCNEVERSLYPWLIKTKANGMRINKKALRELTAQVNQIYDAEEKDFISKYGNVNYGSYIEMEQLFKKLGLPLVYNEETGKPCFDADTLARLQHPLGKQVLHLRGLKKLLGTYLEGQFIDFQYKEHIHGDLYPAKRDEGGTVTGRFSSSKPNLQNVSAREEKFGKEVRSLFIPEAGCLLGAFDYKQIEYRVFTHFAVGEEAEKAQKAYWEARRQGKELDYHQMGQELMGWNWPDDPKKTKIFRHIMKNLGFGSLYGLGAPSFAQRFAGPIMVAHPDADPNNLTPLARELQNMYYEKVPFIKPTCKLIQLTAERRGYVKTVSGRRQRFPPDGKAYKMVNYLIQGSAGDIVKKAIKDSWEAGVWDVLIPHNMVHDELVFSIPDTKEGYEACLKLKECMCNAYQLKVPLGVDTEIGPDWGHCDEDNWKKFEEKWK